MSLPPQMGLSSVNHPSWMIYCEKAPTLHLNINNLYSTSIFFTFMCDGQPALIQLKKGLRVLIARPYIILTADWRPVFHLSLSIPWKVHRIDNGWSPAETLHSIWAEVPSSNVSWPKVIGTNFGGSESNSYIIEF